MKSILLKFLAYSIVIPAVLIIVLMAIIGGFTGVIYEGVRLGWTLGRFITTQAIVASNILQTVVQPPTLRVISPDPDEEEYDGLSS